MSGLREYSGITTKVKAMRSKLFTRDEYEHILEMNTVAEMAEYLKSHSGYEKVFENTEIAGIHRETVEHGIMYSIYSDFNKLYRFVGLNQRKYLKLHLMKYEVELIKKAMRKSSTEYISEGQNKFIKEFFAKYSKVNFHELFQAKDIGQIVRSLEGTIYYEPLKLMMDAGETKLFDYELALDMFYFKYVWKKRRVNFSGSELRCFSDSLGTEADLLNLIWIYRAKAIYKMTQSETAALVIPVYHRIKKPYIGKLIEINDVKELIGEIGRCPYGKHFTPEVFKNKELDKVSKKLIKKAYNKYYRLEPYSMAVISGYLKEKKDETDKLITILECIRYGYPKDAIGRCTD